MNKFSIFHISILFLILTSCKNQAIDASEQSNGIETEEKHPNEEIVQEETFNFDETEFLKKDIEDFIRYFKNENIDSITHFADYPIRLEPPLSDIVDSIDFTKRFHLIFDEPIVQEIIHSDVERDWSEMAQGIMFKNGSLWFSFDMNIIGINYKSKALLQLQEEAINEEKNKLHHSVKDFVSPEIFAKTEIHQLRIDQLENDNLRLALWNIDSLQSSKPLLIIDNGNWEPEGSGGNQRYQFEDKLLQFTLHITPLRKDDTPEARFIVKDILETRNYPVIFMNK